MAKNNITDIDFVKGNQFFTSQEKFTNQIATFD